MVVFSLGCPLTLHTNPSHQTRRIQHGGQHKLSPFSGCKYWSIRFDLSSLFLTYWATRPYDRFNYDANIAGQRQVTHVLAPALEELTPGGGAYLNEADLHQPNFQEVLYGSNYDKLKEIKKNYDPHHFFYGPTAVGSENWQIETDGRLCRVTHMQDTSRW